MTLKSNTKFEEKLTLCFGKSHEQFGKISPEHLKVSNLGLWWDLLNPKYKRYEVKIYGELCVMTMKNNAKFEEELTCGFRIYMGNLMDFDRSTWKSQKCSL